MSTKNDSVEIQVTITTDANGLSSAINLGTARLWAIQMPAAWTGTALTIQGSSDGVTFADVYRDGIEYTIPATASQVVTLLSDLIGLQYLKLRSGTAATPVQQASDRVLKLIALSRLV